MSKHRERLVKVLSTSIPEWRGSKLLWKADCIYPSFGIWRQKKMDVMSWLASACRADDPKQDVILFVGCWETMGDCIKAGAVELDARGEVIAPKVKP